jgi:hypothetical protein
MTIDRSSQPGLPGPDEFVRNSAVQRCVDARRLAIDEANGTRLQRYEIKEMGNRAYRGSLPDLLGFENIQNFIACVAYGMILNVFDPIESSKLLYAAQVALSAFRREPAVRKSAAG